MAIRVQAEFDNFMSDVCEVLNGTPDIQGLREFSPTTFKLFGRVSVRGYLIETKVDIEKLLDTAVQQKLDEYNVLVSGVVEGIEAMCAQLDKVESDVAQAKQDEKDRQGPE